ncbi:polysaccharide biosynthesis/export family protein [Luteolibacter algae]|uniref:Polysaccharide biosynthesis/export family protein n=1 Tax=Luteolibacter algae TaxID=454151 RepID=A0ABW5D4E8_9BACT
MNLRSIFIAFLAILGLITPTMAQIQSGQAVQITIMGVPAEEKQKIDAVYPVSQSGTVNMPFIGVVRASGLQPETLAASIQNAYRAAQIYTNPTIQVIASSGDTLVEQMVHIGGQVRRPGPAKYSSNLTIYQAVQAAGGATEFGSLKRVKLYRNGKTQVFDLTNPQFMRVPLKPDDTIEVPQKNWLGQ